MTKLGDDVDSKRPSCGPDSTIRHVLSMSPHNNSRIYYSRGSTWDPDNLRLDQHTAALSKSVGRSRGRRPPSTGGKFILGPIDVSWLCRASCLGVKALLVGLALWHLRGLRRSDSVIVSNLMVQDWGIKPAAKRRALVKLEKAGLIAIERRGKRSPRVSLVLGVAAGQLTTASSPPRPG
jgi:DNA-binding transcriptional ArsR family regulator